MRSTLDEVLAVLGDLEAFVHSIDKVNVLLASHADPDVRNHFNIRRRLDGAAFIVALYSAFEKFVEELSWAFAELEASVTSYADLHEGLRFKHLKQSAELLARGRLGEGRRYAGLTEANVVANLHLCLSGQSPYKLNRDAVVYHEHNFRANVVQASFSALGIEKINESVRCADALVNWYSSMQGVSPGDPVPLTTIEVRLEDFVEYRNQVAHTGTSPGSLLGPDDMRELLAFVRSYCISIHTVVVGEYLNRRYVTKPGASVKLGDILEGPFRKNGDAVVVAKPQCRVFLDQPVFGMRDGRVDRYGLVKGIQVDGRDMHSVEVNSTAKSVGLRVDFRVTKGTQLYLLQSRDAVVWP
ncbi:MAE_28990/MAE_18760 family HEPN-like nuclease [Polyangium sp. y55x31]|uniref:MAE_28990/MAE_18760 family HEPN-like nuclease n=1 Tax=Polyangium sp. y55x31 TaxID=3042688 RepID=UPI002482B47F|nr:MAE_28990/MAE_18760 family HEPN-like nuclease [Polyangium sp. y55x31]MDI1481428.1 MAE_28990/MAE_18760 family HEPN-like nuclease [Polyangium sp. y55x31]